MRLEPPQPSREPVTDLPAFMRRHRLLGLRTAGVFHPGPAALGVPRCASPQNRHRGSSHIPFLPL